MRIRAHWLIVFALIPAGLAAQRQPDVRAETPIEIESPAAPGSAAPNLHVAPDGRIFLSWIEPGREKGHALRFSVLNRQQWSEPRTIAEGENWFVNWADFPSLIALPAGRMGAHWLVKSAASPYAYDVSIAASMDDGKTWSKPITPHRDGTPTEHGFVSLLGLHDGSLGVVWLDGRNFKGSENEGHGPSRNEMTLRYARVDKLGRLNDEAVLDGRVCECCQTSAAMSSQGPVVAYRDRSQTEIRDISVVRLVSGRWLESKPLFADNWRIEGCPVNGPSVSADGNRVVVGWLTAAGVSPTVKVAFSTDSGASFGAPIRIDDGSPMGRVQTLVLPDKSALILWLERAGKGGEIRMRRVLQDGTLHKSITVSETGLARASGFPRMARSGGELVFAWTDSNKPSRVRTARLRLRID